MPVRTTMAALITQVRGLIHDPAGAGQVLDDQTIQDRLDHHRQDVRMLPLHYQVTLQNGGGQAWLDYYAPDADWEDDVELKASDYTVLTPALTENLVGHWQFSTSQYPPVYLTGKTYDCFATAADLLEQNSAAFLRAYDATQDGQTLRRSQILPNFLELAKSYRRQARAQSGRLVREDIRQRQPYPRLGRLIPRVYDE